MRYTIASCLLMLAVSANAFAGVRSEAAKEAVEYIMKKFGNDAAEYSAKELASEIGVFAAKYGDDVTITAAKKVGPSLFRLVKGAGANGEQAIKLLAREGDSAIWIVSRPKSFSLFMKYGDDAAKAMMLHREMAETLIESYGGPMSRALAATDGQNARRLAMLADEGVLSKILQKDDVLDVIGKYGDKAAGWVWENKGAITVVTVAAAFVKDPTPFISGAVKVVDIGGSKIIQPVAEAAAKSLNWNLIVGVTMSVFAAIIGLKILFKKTRRSVLREKTSESAGDGDDSIQPEKQPRGQSKMDVGGESKEARG